MRLPSFLQRLAGQPAKTRRQPRYTTPRRVAQYDFANQANSAGGRKRRAAVAERTGEEGQLTPDRRLQAINLSRDMLRNNPQFRGLAKTLRTNIVGDFGKLRFNATDDWSAAAQRWFNGVWGRRADFRDGSTFRECLQLAVSALATEGDFVCVFDGGEITGGAGTGKLLFFEADQIVSLDDASFAPYSARGLSQESGVIFDAFGRMVGVNVTGRHGLTRAKASESFTLVEDDPYADRDWVFVRRKFRLDQARGSADAIPSIQGVVDCYEMLGYEMQTAKVASSRYAFVEVPDGADDTLSPLGFDAEATSGAGDGDQPAAEPEQIRASALETYTGGGTDYGPAGTKITFQPTDRPNANLPAFLDYVGDLTGQALGLNHAYARGRADTSYTAFRGDMVMTWMSFRDFQQFLEDAFSDWVAVKAIRFGVSRGEIPGVPPDGWEGRIAWSYPTIPAVDEQKEQGALALKLKNGLTTYREILGPAWRETLQQLADELAFARSLNLPVSPLGGEAEPKPQETTNDQD